jgi:hypothetical protein
MFAGLGQISCALDVLRRGMRACASPPELTEIIPLLGGFIAIHRLLAHSVRSIWPAAECLLTHDFKALFPTSSESMSIRRIRPALADGVDEPSETEGPAVNADAPTAIMH